MGGQCLLEDEVDTDLDVDADVDTGLDADVDTGLDADADTPDSPDADIDTGLDTDADTPDVDTDTPDVDTGLDADTDVDTGFDADTDVETGLDADADTHDADADADTHDADVDTGFDADADTEPDTIEIVTVASCADAPGDGPVLIDLDGDGPRPPFAGHCLDVATDEPRMYLDLPSEADGANAYVWYHNVEPTETCVFSKIRIDDPVALTVLGSDDTFADCEGGPGSRQIRWGSANSCTTAFASVGNPGNGSMNVDLTGTPFRVVSTWAPSGLNPAGGILSDEGGVVVTGWGNGFCGGLRPDGPLTLDY